MKFIADLHVHSKFSRATAKNLDLENLYIAAQLKGVTVVGTGDFTHPAWIAEIQEKLVPAEAGLFRIRQDIAEICDAQVPRSCRAEVRFMLQCEISNIYKKAGKTRKNHHVIFVPDIGTACQFNAKLDAIGNIKSDGRPILGLDARDLLEILLECSDESFLIPAHIWTPWFSVLGSKSGFDSLEECFEDLVREIFAVETGLSSDPRMNWRVSQLDQMTLVSNSDAHSPMNLARNANVFDTECAYPAIRSALKSGDPAQCLGTLDMYPEEGKYHFDGHRKCDVCLHPSETMSKRGICPACGKALTIGVLYRVEELADRAEGEKPDSALLFQHIIPLAEILSEICGVGPKTKKVNAHYQTALEALGPETRILTDCPTDDIDTAGIPLLGEAIRRMRAGKIHISPGYDGEYGKITVFNPEEKEELLGQKTLFAMPPSKTVGKKKKPPVSKPKKLAAGNVTDKLVAVCEKSPRFGEETDMLKDLNDKQRHAVQHEGRPLLIIAGPGAGKTRTLTHKIAYMVKHRNVLPENILGVTFTNKAAQEMRDRLRTLMGDVQNLPLAATFHGLCFQILKEQGHSDYSIIDEDEQKGFVAEAMRQVGQKGISVHLRPNTLSDMISSAKQQILLPGDDLGFFAEASDISLFSAVYETYQMLLTNACRYDYEDLILNVVKCLESDEKVRKEYQNRFQHIFVDEYQDLNHGQYRLVRALAPPDSALCVIGDPDQSIYGFRGADVRYFQCFAEDYPQSRVIHLTRNYRSAEVILDASHQVIREHSISPSGARVYSDIKGIGHLTILESATEKGEAVAVGRTIESMVGGTGFHSIDFGKTRETGIRTDLAFSDFAVLYRSNAQAKVISEVLSRAGIPCQIANREHAYRGKGVAELLSFLKITEDMGIFNDFQQVVNLPDSGVSKKTCDIFRDWFHQKALTLKQALWQMKRIPVPGMITSQQRRLCAFADRISGFKKEVAEKSVEEKLMFLFENTSVSPMIRETPRTSDAFDNLVRVSTVFGDKIYDFFEMIALQTHDADTYNIEAQKVALMTIHSAKGLEFPVVFITGCEKDYLPFRRFEHEAIDVDEERRLFYVAMTRAKDRLFLTYAKKRNIYGNIVPREISPFVADIEQRLLSTEAFQFKKDKKSHQVQLGLFG